jgi:6-phosphofructokinase 1
VDLLLKGEAGRMVGIQNNQIVSHKIGDILTKRHELDQKLIQLAKELSI